MAKLTKSQRHSIEGARFWLQHIAALLEGSAQGDATLHNALVDGAVPLAQQTREKERELFALTHPNLAAFLSE